jgi:ribosomal protein S18 acetylase RimI-like enzyme
MAKGGFGGYAVRDADGEDMAVLTGLWREFRAQTPEPEWRAGTPDEHLDALAQAIRADVVLIAERQGEPVGFALAEVTSPGVGYLHILYVRPQVRRTGLAARLIRELARRFERQGVVLLELDVRASNTVARSPSINAGDSFPSN